MSEPVYRCRRRRGRALSAGHERVQQIAHRGARAILDHLVDQARGNPVRRAALTRRNPITLAVDARLVHRSGRLTQLSADGRCPAPVRRAAVHVVGIAPAVYALSCQCVSTAMLQSASVSSSCSTT